MNHFDLPDAPTRITSILNNATLKKQFETAFKSQNNELLLFYKEPLTVEFSLANHQLSLRILPIKEKSQLILLSDLANYQNYRRLIYYLWRSVLTTFTTTSIRIFGKFNNEAKDRGCFKTLSKKKIPILKLGRI